MSEMAVNYTGTWDMVSNVNFEGYMIALGVDFATRKVAALLKPQKVINQEGNHFNIRTLTTFRNYEIAFKVGVEYKEETKGMDNRICQVEYTRRRLKEWITAYARVWSTGKMTSWCVFSVEKKGTEAGFIGFRKMNFIWNLPVKLKSASKFTKGHSEFYI
ncbi:retinoid-binding protein 7 isoform X1 [Syngnathus scovelli]|uniref:retinoid-binding protein 7 isoform X1 n=1 Tax=Syngnathus scovelli TaxID=161590 RepID=UPI00210FBC10|nr:retinoid-binding protein 7 isoform X1 [Syngnathus scovelli]